MDIRFWYHHVSLGMPYSFFFENDAVGLILSDAEELEALWDALSDANMI